MEIALQIILLIVGFVLLIKGADFFVDGIVPDVIGIGGRIFTRRRFGSRLRRSFRRSFGGRLRRCAGRCVGSRRRIGRRGAVGRRGRRGDPDPLARRGHAQRIRRKRPPPRLRTLRLAADVRHPRNRISRNFFESGLTAARFGATLYLAPPKGRLKRVPDHRPEEVPRRSGAAVRRRVTGAK